MVQARDRGTRRAGDLGRHRAKVTRLSFRYPRFMSIFRASFVVVIFPTSPRGRSGNPLFGDKTTRGFVAPPAPDSSHGSDERRELPARVSDRRRCSPHARDATAEPRDAIRVCVSGVRDRSRQKKISARACGAFVQTKKRSTENPSPVLLHRGVIRILFMIATRPGRQFLMVEHMPASTSTTKRTPRAPRVASRIKSSNDEQRRGLRFRVAAVA